MLGVPAIAFYVATIAMVVVCIFIAVLLFYLIKAARIAITFSEFIETEGRRLYDRSRRIRRAFDIASALFANDADLGDIHR